MNRLKQNGVRNLLFDLGGVIMNLRRENCVVALQKLGLKEAEELLGLYCQSGPFLMLEEGKLSPAEFRKEICDKIGKHIDDEVIDTAFNEFLIGIPLARLHQLDELRKDYKIYMLSNTNAIMFNSKIKEEFEQDGKSVKDYFDGICVSYEEGCAKPDRQIFVNLLKKFNIKAEETLFFDDSQKNLDAAEEMGFQTWLVEPGTEFIDAFKE